jgi:Na+-transporting NADH:ubiquinone oxidoreductase subunit NqrC
MRINTVLQKKYPVSSDMYNKVESTKVCMLYNELVQTSLVDLKASEAVSIQNGSLAIVVNSNYEAQKIKLYEFDIIQNLNQAIDTVKFQVQRLQIRIS